MARGPWTFRCVAPERPNAEVLSAERASSQLHWDPETRINPGSSSMLGCAEQSACMLQADCPLPPFCCPFPFLSVPFPRLVVGFGVPSRQGQNPEAQEPRLSQSRMRDWVSCHPRPEGKDTNQRKEMRTRCSRGWGEERQNVSGRSRHEERP